MNFKANYQIVPLSGTMDLMAMGYGNTSGSSVHQIFCLTSGSITISAIGGGTATVPLTGGQTIDCLIGAVTVVSGTFIGFRSQSQGSYLTAGFNGQ